MWSLIAVILHIGNLEFVDQGQQHGNVGSTLTTEPDAICALLGVTKDDIQDALCFRTVRTGRESVTTPVAATGANDSVRAMSKAIFQRLFTWLVAETNKHIAPKKGGSKKALGVLDIYGFEHFVRNSYEQFCINYANEKVTPLQLTLGWLVDWLTTLWLTL